MSHQPWMFGEVPSTATIEPASMLARREAHETQDLPLADLEIVALVDDYCHATGHPDVTGRELAAWAGRDVLGVRPRLCGARQAHWLEVHDVRASRESNERTCAPYALAVPRVAVDRAIAAETERTSTILHARES